jgi:hypothetical protein
MPEAAPGARTQSRPQLRYPFGRLGLPVRALQSASGVDAKRAAEGSGSSCARSSSSSRALCWTGPLGSVPSRWAAVVAPGPVSWRGGRLSPCRGDALGLRLGGARDFAARLVGPLAGCVQDASLVPELVALSRLAYLQGTLLVPTGRAAVLLASIAGGADGRPSVAAAAGEQPLGPVGVTAWPRGVAVAEGSQGLQDHASSVGPSPQGCQHRTGAQVPAQCATGASPQAKTATEATLMRQQADRAKNA